MSLNTTGVQPPFNAEEMLERLGGDMELLQDLVNLYDVDGRQMLSDLQAALDGGDAQGVERSAHRIRGSVASFSAGHAAAAAWAVEEFGRDGKLEEARAAFGVLDEALATLNLALHHYLEHPAP